MKKTRFITKIIFVSHKNDSKPFIVQKALCSNYLLPESNYFILRFFRKIYVLLANKPC